MNKGLIKGASVLLDSCFVKGSFTNWREASEKFNEFPDTQTSVRVVNSTWPCADTLNSTNDKQNTPKPINVDILKTENVEKQETAQTQSQYTQTYIAYICTENYDKLVLHVLSNNCVCAHMICINSK